jgi:hypothetical protein
MGDRRDMSRYVTEWLTYVISDKDACFIELHSHTASLKGQTNGIII